MKTWIKEHGFDIAFYAVIVAASLLVLAAPADAAPSAPADVCEKVASIPSIDVYYCQPDYGLPFYINSLGFMTLEN